MSTRVGAMRRVAAIAAAFALALNLAIGALASAVPEPLDTFGQPICSEHAAGSDNPSAPADTAQCQFCCVLSVADSVTAPVLPLPSGIEWRSPPRVLTAAPLPRPSRHLTGPPRGPPL